MTRLFRSVLVLATVILLSNCVNVEMETTVNDDRSGKGRLVYSWDPEQNMDAIDIDQTFSMIERNPTVQVTGNREYDSDGVHYREITWTFEDINEVDLEGLNYSFRTENGKFIFRAIFEEVEIDNPQQSETVISSETPLDTPAQPAEPGETSSGISSAAAGTGEDTFSAGNKGGSAGSSPDQGLDPQTQMEMDAEMQQQMEEMFQVMIMNAVEGFSVQFMFLLPYEILEAPGAKIEGNTATWEIPLKELLGSGVSESGKYDQFIMVMNAEQ